MDVISCSSKPHPNLSETPLSNSDLVFYTDGSAYRENGVPHAGYAICDNFSIVESAALPPSSSAQVAESYALMRAFQLAKGKTVTIYTDSRYAFGCLHDFGILWANRGFITSSGTPVKHGKLIGELLDTCQLPSSIAVVKCEAHTKSNDPVSQSNALADHAAKAAAKIGSPVHVKLCPSIPANDLASPNDVALLQETADVKEHRLWLSHGCKYANNLWVHNDGRIVAHTSLYPWLARMSHSLSHVSKGGMCQIVLKDWYAPGFTSYTKKYCAQCLICQQHNPGKPVQTTISTHPPPRGLFETLQVDFIHMPQCEGYENIIVVKCLLKDIVPRFSIPQSINSDRGTHFAGQIMTELCKSLGIKQRLHCPYQPQSAGLVERQNGILKKLAKLRKQA